MDAQADLSFTFRTLIYRFCLSELDVSDNKLKTFPSKLEQLKQRCSIVTEGQSSYKQRDPPDFLKAGEAQTQNKEAKDKEIRPE